MLGLVDDIVGISEVGYKSHQMNTVINAKTAEKGLRFSATKCKTMLVGRCTEFPKTNALVVDSWKKQHVKNAQTGEEDLIESYEGKVEIEAVQKQKYLGFVISNLGGNMANILAAKKKSIGIIKQIFEKLNCLKLKKYYFECGLIFMNVMLRSSILYASETYYDLKENELRAIERIEEGYMRKLVKTTAGCPIVQLYLELSQIPARFAIMRSRLLFLKDILNQKEDSRISLFVKLQLEQSTKGDWISTCLNDFKLLNISESLEGIKSIKITKYRKIINERIQEYAFSYLMKKRKSKGSELSYPEFQMAEYLLPNDKGITIEDQQYLFGIRNKMVKIPANFGTSFNCVCGMSYL